MSPIPGRIRSILRTYEHYASESAAVFRNLGYSATRAQALDRLISEFKDNAADSLRAMHAVNNDFSLEEEISRLDQVRIYCMRTYLADAPTDAQGRLADPAVQQAIDKILNF